VGTPFWNLNHSIPGVQSRFQYSRGWSARNLDARADDERHEKEIQKMQQPEPGRKS